MNVAILGFGIVGSGVAEVIKNNCKSIEENSNISLKVTRILDIRDFPDSEYKDILTKNFDDILSDDSIDVVVETMGGVEPAFTFVSECLKKGKHVVSSNKRGNLSTTVVRGDREAIENAMRTAEPKYFELIPLTLEEIFISEMEERGYDYSNVIF